MSAQESFCFSTLPHHPAGRRQTCRTRLSVDKSIEATTPHGPATWLASCVLGVARSFECSEVARTADGACTSDRRSVGAGRSARRISVAGKGLRNGGCSTSVVHMPGHMCGAVRTTVINAQTGRRDATSQACESASRAGYNPHPHPKHLNAIRMAIIRDRLLS